ncbi:MAG: hypothetical protein KGJ41_15185 [Rhodospirillales bacterium]|nr:hypothetical protein [Rhodospirillales bacterium]MDE2200357.1 hypothetical protein [Rhodospirillales bacterium]
MSDKQSVAVPAFGPEATLASAQHHLASLSTAWTRLAHGVMAASVAQVELARSMAALSPQDWEGLMHPANPQDAAQQWLHATRARLERLTAGARQINDELVANLFTVAEGLVQALQADWPMAEPPTAAPGAAPGAASGGAGRPVAGPAARAAASSARRAA